MSVDVNAEKLFSKYVVANNHAKSDYFGLIRELIAKKREEGDSWNSHMDHAYELVADEIEQNSLKPTAEISFGTSGWRGKLGKDIFVKSVVQVTRAIVQMYQGVDKDKILAEKLGLNSSREAQARGCVIGFDNRFGGELLAIQAAKVLVEAGFAVHYAGETTTGVLSAAVLEGDCAFSINLTPSHNPLEYGGYKFNGADAGPAATPVTEEITSNARKIVEKEAGSPPPALWSLDDLENCKNVKFLDSLKCWKDLVRDNEEVHGLNLQKIMSAFDRREDCAVAIDCVHGASRLHILELFEKCGLDRLQLFRDEKDVTFGGVAPEPSTTNIQGVHKYLGEAEYALKLGAIIDPDGDRIRFTDGTTEISMNQFGAMAYHFLHEKKEKKGMVAKTVATSNLANSLARMFSEELFEPSVGFKNFKPVIGKALVIFEESDGISVAGHTPEKDAYIGLLLALDMVLTNNMNLGDYLRLIERQYGEYYPDRDGITVSVQGEELLQRLQELEKYDVGVEVEVGEKKKKIEEVLTIDGRKMIFSDGSWLMIRPSGTEPKVRFYVESRTHEGTVDLVEAAKGMLQEIGLVH